MTGYCHKHDIQHFGLCWTCDKETAAAPPRGDVAIIDWVCELEAALRHIRTAQDHTEARSLDRMVSSRLIACVPTTWLDDLLTGPRAVLSGKGGTWGCPDIERLLNAIRERMTKAANDGDQR